MNQLKIKKITKENIPAVLKLYRKEFNLKLTKNYFHLKFFENPFLFNSPLNFVATEPDGTVVGHSAFIPGEYKTDNEKIWKGALSAGSVVSKEFPGLFPEIYQKLEELMILKGFDFLFAFPNENSHPFFIKLFNYTNIHFEYLSLKRTKSKDPLIRYNHSNQVLKSSFRNNYLKWRLKSSKNNYIMICVDNVKLFYKKFLRDEIDIIAIEDLGGDICAKSLYKFFDLNKDIRCFNIYSTDHLFSSFLYKIGFEVLETRNKCVYKNLNKSLSNERYLFQMIDSDIF